MIGLRFKLGEPRDGVLTQGERSHMDRFKRAHFLRCMLGPSNLCDPAAFGSKLESCGIPLKVCFRTGQAS